MRQPTRETLRMLPKPQPGERRRKRADFATLVLGLACIGLPAATHARAMGGASGLEASDGGRVPAGLERFAPDEVQAQQEREVVLIDAVDPNQLRHFMHTMAASPHPAGSPGDLALIAWMAETFAAWGLEVQTQWFDAYLAVPVSAELQIVGETTIDLPLIEAAVEGDPYSAGKDFSFGWNAYSGTGDVTGEVVYANYGRLEDFQRLESLGIDVSGKIVIARYGGNYRGYKAKFAEEAGAIGLIIFTDPANSGYSQGLPWPEGGYANDSSIQRGSIKTLDYVGDPLTPGVFAATTDDEAVDRLSPEALALPKIPVQPIGWAAAQQIMERMRGPEIADGGWQGGLPLRYRLTGGKDLRVRLAVEQERGLVRTANVIATLPGEHLPDEVVVIGCHHDAWTFGAADPLAGLVCLFESARNFAERAKQGDRPARTIRFAAWGAEEFGIIGSTEFIESLGAADHRNIIAYINLDMAAMGPNFSASAWPSLKQVVLDATRGVPPAASASGETVFEAWSARAGGTPAVGMLGGGSDHVPFLMHAGIPSIALGAGGSRGVSYHSAYDNIAWYEAVVGKDYASATMITRVLNVLTARLANATLHPIQPGEPLRMAGGHMEDLRKRINAAELMNPTIERGLALIEQRAEAIAQQLDASGEALQTMLGLGRLTSPRHRAAVNALLRDLDRGWLGTIGGTDNAGLTGRPWFANLLIATDATSGYAAWLLPELRAAIEQGNQEAIEAAIQRYAFTLELIGSINHMGMSGMAEPKAE